jgi:iron complex outermembrane receptor protein
MSDRESLTLAAGWTDNHHGELTQWLSQSRPLETPPSELGNSIAYSKANVNATYRRVKSHSLAYTVKANWYRTHWKNDYQDNQDYAITHKAGAEAQVDWIWKAHAITFGGEAVLDRATSLIYGNPQTVDMALYGEDELKFAKRLTLTLGTRFDYHHVRDVYSDGEVNPRFGLVFRPASGTSIRISAGHGFRAPSIAEVFADITVSGIRVVKNLNLREAERAWSYELGAGQALDLQDAAAANVPFLLKPLATAAAFFRPVFFFDAAVFYSRYRNMIDVDFNPDVMGFQFMNMGRARTRGLEARVKASVFGGAFTGQAGYTLLDPKDLDQGTMLHYRSRHRLNAGAELRVWKLAFGLDYRYASRIETVANLYSSDERVPMHVMDGRILLDLDAVDFALECRNLRNYQYTLRQRFLEPIRHYVLTARMRL